MGKAEDPMAVVDKYLNVRGVKGLRVVDCSIMPTLHSGHTQMPAFGIAEKAAEYMRQSAAGRNGMNGHAGSNGVNGHAGSNGVNGH